MQTEHQNAIAKAIDRLLSISSLAQLAQSSPDIEPRHLQAIAQGIEALANPLIDDLLRLSNE